MPKLTVLLPVYNAEKYISEAVSSILNQSFQDFELLVINDCSTDETLNIISSFEDKRIKVISNEQNMRLVYSLNKGLGEIDSEYVVRMDADDISEPDRLLSLNTFMDEHSDIGVCGSLMQSFGNTNELWDYHETDEYIKPGILYRSLVAHPTVIMRMKVLQENQFLYSEKFIHSEDRELWFRIMQKTKFHNLKRILYRYRVSGDNITLRNRHTYQERILKFYTHIFSELGIPYTDSVLRIHAGHGELIAISKETIHEYFNWILSLKEWNIETGTFDKVAFDFHCTIIWKRQFKRVMSYGNFQTMRQYSKLSEGLELKSWMKFFRTRFTL